MSATERLLELADVHPEWRDILRNALANVDPEYLDSLLHDDCWLPGPEALLAAFRRDRSGLRYLLIGESPYPRRESANGIAFYDAAVGELWSTKGLSTAVNRATSLRNIIKTALLAGGLLQKDSEGKIPQAAIAAIDKQSLVGTLDELFANLQGSGFLLLNATPVLHPGRKPAVEARYWQPFLERLLASIAAQAGTGVTLLLWGKIAERIDAIEAGNACRKLVCEHPYNLSFIDNPQIRALFAELAPLQLRSG